MEDWTVLRTIPEKLRAGVEAGQYTVHGGVVRNAGGTRSIVGHLMVADPAGLQSLGNAFGPLLAGTMALGAMNLVVSAAGFVVVTQRLKALDKKLNKVIDKLDQLLTGQMKMMWDMELERRSRFEANLENLARGLRIRDVTMTSVALSALTHSATFYRRTTAQLLEDVRQAYQEPLTLHQCMQMVFGASLAQAHALALRGHPSEAISLLDGLEEWHEDQRKALDAPRKARPVPAWMARLPYEAVQGCQAVVKWQQEVPEGLSYARGLYQFCIDNTVTVEDICQLTEGEALAFIAPRDGA